jgi:hypothetical protein
MLGCLSSLIVFIGLVPNTLLLGQKNSLLLPYVALLGTLSAFSHLTEIY